MDMLGAWDSLGWIDGLLFSLWLGAIYYGKCWIDNKFKIKLMWEI